MLSAYQIFVLTGRRGRRPLQGVIKYPYGKQPLRAFFLFLCLIRRLCVLGLHQAVVFVELINIVALGGGHFAIGLAKAEEQEASAAHGKLGNVRKGNVQLAAGNAVRIHDELALCQRDLLVVFQRVSGNVYFGNKYLNHL